MDDDRILCHGARALCGTEHAVLQTALGDLHTLLSLVGCEDGVSRSCRATCLGLLQTRCILVEDRLSSGCRDLRRVTKEDITEGSKDLLTAQRVARHTGEDFGEGLPIEDAEGIGDTILTGSESSTLLLAQLGRAGGECYEKACRQGEVLGKLLHPLLTDDSDELDDEDERATGLDHLTSTAVAIGKIRGDSDLPLRAYGHKLEDLRPTLDDALQGEPSRLATVHRAVEDLTIDQRTVVVALDRIGELGLGTVTHLDDLILQAAGQGDDTRLVAVDLEEFFACFLVLLDGLATYFLEVVVDDDLGFVVGHLRLSAFEYVTYTSEEVFQIDLIEARGAEVLADAQPEGIAYFIHCT